MQREKLGSRLGFILLSAGCAIGIGNVWKFPYMAAQYGGGAFVLIYLFFLLILGVPVMTMEFSMGRASQKSPAKMYEALEPKGSKWHIHSAFAVLGNYVLMMFYTTVAGWMLYYFVATAKGDFVGTSPERVTEIFGEMNSNPLVMGIFITIVVCLGFGVCAIGLQKGLEKITKLMMSALLVLMLVLAVNSIFTDGAVEGIKYYLIPDFNRMMEIGIVEVIVGAMSQAFFTLSLGLGAMAIFGSYLDKERSLMGEAVNVAFLDTFVALASGLIVIPACFAYNVELTSGPNLIFITLPNIFNNMPLGRLWGSLFFVFLSFAALSTVFTVFEGIIACTQDLLGWSRKKCCLINAIVMTILSMPCMLGFNVLKNVKLGDRGIMDIEDFIVSNMLLPLGSLIFVLFCTTKWGWGFDNFKKEANAGKGLGVSDKMRGYLTYVLPVIILVVFIMGIV